jgi:hypothetical protein
MMLPGFAVMKGQNEIYLNIYSQSRFDIPLNSKNRIIIDQITNYPVSDEIQFNINPAKPENFTIALRIPSWSIRTSIAINDVVVADVVQGTYKKITRLWQSGDKIKVKMDMRGRLITKNDYQAIVRGPIVLARDTRFNDGFIYESAVVRDQEGFVELKSSTSKPENIWMSFTVPLVLGTDLEGEFRNPKQVSFCDFASAGNTWGEDSRYRVWIQKTLNVMNSDYKSY